MIIISDCWCALKSMVTLKMDCLKTFNMVYLMCFLWTVNGVTPPGDMLGNLPNFDPIHGEMEDLEFRVAIEGYKQDCFYQEAKKDHNLEINYQVIETSSRFGWMFSPTNNAADLVIDFFVKEPQGAIHIHEYGKQEGSHVITVKEDGVYTLCFENKVSSNKLINVEVYLYSNDDDDRWGYLQDKMTFPPDVQYMDTIESIRVSVNKVRDALNKIVHSQDEKRAIEKRDWTLAHKNLEYISRFSMVSTLLIIAVGIGQIFIIRSLFEEKSYLRKIFKFM